MQEQAIQHLAEMRDLAERIRRLAEHGADVPSGEHAAYQSQIASMGDELAELVLHYQPEEAS